MSSLIGKVLGRNYRVLEPIGAGAMGMVFLVEHVVLPRQFAAKVLSPELARHPEAIARFEVEAHAVSQLEHENIVSVVDYGKTDDGCLFIVMELLRGKTLQARMDQGSVSLDEIFSVMIQVCRALGAAHAAGIVHRDMKPENVFLAQRRGMRPLVKVLDFGVSKVREGSVRDGRITRRGQILGSPEYMSPEASRGDEVDARADVYAVGIMLYQLLCGDVPFRHESYLKVLQMHVTQAPVPPRLLAPGLSDAIEHLILRALEKHPDHRPRSMEEFELELIAAMPDVAERATFATETPDGVPWAHGSAQPVTIIVDDTHPSLPPESVAPWSSRTSSPAPPPREGTTLDIRRRRSRAVAVALWCGVLAVASAAGIGLWLEPRDRRADPAPARARPATIGTPSPSDAVEPALPVTRSGDIRLHIDSSPRGATVTLHGRPLGLTPIDIQVPPADRHGQVQLELRGYRTARRSIARARNGEVRVSLQREGARTHHSGRPEPPRRSSESSDGPEIKKRR